MELRSGSLVGGSSGILSAQMRPIFEHGVTLIFKRSASAITLKLLPHKDLKLGIRFPSL